MESAQVLTSIRPDECSVTQVLAFVGSKWTPLVIFQLNGGPRRYGELMRTLPGISPKTLADRLHLLESEGLISRTVYPDKPPRVEYALTERGCALGAILDDIAQWAANPAT